MPGNEKNHIILDPGKISETARYNYPGTGYDNISIPAQNRTSHTAELRKQVETITREMAAAIALQERSNSLPDRGLIVEFESFEGTGRAFEERKIGRDSELLNIKYNNENDRAYAAVFVTNDTIQDFNNKITSYHEERKGVTGQSLGNEKLIDTIANINKATVRTLWTDTIPLPENDTDILCWEVWLSVRQNRKQQLAGFKELAKTLGIETSETFFEFRERTVLLARATTRQFEQSLELMNNIAELRKAKTLATLFTGMDGKEQNEWLVDLQRLTVLKNSAKELPFICILDSGVNAAHPLLEKSIDINDLHTINPAWGTADIAGHGTEVAGLSLYGDLTEALETNERMEIRHRLESSKIINASEYTPTDSDRSLDLYADFIKQGVAQAEISEPRRKRLFQMAITAMESRDMGRPSSWSSALDTLAAGIDNGGGKRLFVIAAGNAAIGEANTKYPDYNLSEAIRDPGQAWNILTIGAYTEKDLLSDDERIDDSRPTASHGEISPYTTTSSNWDAYWPLKPDIVMEGGNTAENQYGKVQADSLSLLTTKNRFIEKPLGAMWATSAASALAAKMCAQIMARYPAFSPETVRALMVHSASWTDAMLKQFNIDSQKPSKHEYSRLVRICGFGVPSLNRAMSSVGNDFTMIVEDYIQPYKIENGVPKDNQIKFYTLPFPKEELMKLGETDIEMRVTLSYFIEPNPSSRGRSRHSYQSHGLRFNIKNPSETEERFKGRMSKALREEGEDYQNDATDKWKLGIKGRARGSIHSDIWFGSAAELAGCNSLAVFPTKGWWKTKKEKKANNIASFSILISIKTSVDVDLMSPVELQVSKLIKTSVNI